MRHIVNGMLTCWENQLSSIMKKEKQTAIHARSVQNLGLAVACHAKTRSETQQDFDVETIYRLVKYDLARCFLPAEQIQQ